MYANHYEMNDEESRAIPQILLMEDEVNVAKGLQMVLDDEFIAGLRRLVQGITLHDVQEEMALIKAKTPRGSFLGSRHTRRTFREHWLPGILDRDTYETWLAKGQTVEQTCRHRVEDILAHHQPPPLPAEVEAELERILHRYLGPGFSFHDL